jgi:hypothetical protein
MANKHLPNRELKILDSDTDFFGHIDKGNAIVSFLKSNVDDLSQANMIALYGKWGSGKSTLMKYIGTELEKGDYKSLYFPAWEFEKDENLPLSLTHFITNETGVSSDKVASVFLKNASEVLKSLGKGLSIDAQILKFDLANVINSEEDYYKNEAERNESRYTKTKEFKGKFREIEKRIIKKIRKKKIIIFIDDLDRCEPENVLNLISAIKLFFTYTDDVVFMFGCDKDAIAKAIQHKYGNVINADEYLEKVIDVSFSMPKDTSIHKLLNHYFPGETMINSDNKNNSLFLQNFFKEINFTNPRKLKKVLNKYEIICGFKGQTSLSSIHRDLIPNIVVNQTGDLMETIFVLFFIILYEFYQETFSDLLNYDKKIITYANALIEDSKRRDSTASLSLSNALISVQNTGYVMKSLDISFDEIRALVIGNQTHHKENRFNFFLSIFSPSNYTNKYNTRETGLSFISQFYDDKNSDGEKITLNFCAYLWNRRDDVLFLNSNYKIISFFRMCQTLL